jgi:oligopeptide/dipeptide ABC transporter ATP-binding protein
MYLGKVVEEGPAVSVMDSPIHPYTKALISAIPSHIANVTNRNDRIRLAGDPPSPINPPTGCTFHPRCAFAQDHCKTQKPALEPHADRQVSCLRHAEF